jgi:hypothetical protein
MSDDMLRSLIWVGLAVAIVVVFMVLELVLRTLTNRYATPQEGYHQRTATQLPRVQQ